MIDEFHRIDQGPSTDVAHLLAELSRPDLPCRTPLVDYAQHIYDLGVAYNVDPAFFVATAYEEGWYGTYPTAGAWDCHTHTGTFNWVSISNAAYGGHPVAGSRWGQYPDVATGIEAFFKLITLEYYPLGQNTLRSVWWGVGGSCNPCVVGTHAYGPCFENPCINFYGTVLGIMNRLEASPPPPPPGCDPPLVYDPLSGGCVQPPDTLPLGETSLAALAAGAGLLGVALFFGWRLLHHVT